MKVAIYLSGIPAKSKNEQKRRVLLDFAQGVESQGDQAVVVTDYQTVDCDLAVIQGWVNSKEGAHLRMRSDAIDRQKHAGRHILVIDSNLFGFLAPEDFNRYLRYSLNGIFPTTGYYWHERMDLSRWDTIKVAYDWRERDWQTHGRNILICLQRDGGWSMGTTPVQRWLDLVVQDIRAVTGRPIVVRPHPGNVNILKTLQIPQVNNIHISQNTDIRNDLLKAHATVTYNSSPGVASLLWGVPVWVTDPDPAKSQAGAWANVDLSKIENPLMPDRSIFYHRLAQCHWNQAELLSGAAWRFMRDRLP